MKDLCRRCGKCCYKKVIIAHQVVITAFPCPYLDTDTNLCTVYEKRHEVNPHCAPIDQAIRQGLLPADCPYVKGVKNYRSPIEIPE